MAGLAAATVVCGLTLSPPAASADTRASTPFHLVWKMSNGSFYTVVSGSGAKKSSWPSLSAAKQDAAELVYHPDTKKITSGGSCLHLSTFNSTHDFWFEPCRDIAEQKWNFVDGELQSTVYPTQRPGMTYSTYGVYRPRLVNNSTWQTVETLARFSASTATVDIPGRSAVVSGAAVPGSTVVIGGAEINVGDDGEWSHTLTGLSLGHNPVHVQQWEKGQVTGELDLDVELPVTALTASAAFGNTPNQKVELSGKAQAGAAIEVRDAAGKQVATGTANSSGEWFLALNAPNTAGEYQVTVSQKVDGDPVNDAKTVTIDYGAGVTISSPANGAEHDGGPISVTGNGQAGSTVTVREKGSDTVLGTGTVSTNTLRYTVDIDDLDDSEHVLQVQQKSKGNNTTTAEVTLNPGKSSVVNPTASVDFDADVAKKATVKGTGSDGATITIKNGATVLGTTTVANGTWSKQIDAIGAGTHTLTIEQTGIEGVQTTTTDIDYGAAVAVTAPSGVIAPGRTTVTGTTQPGAKVSVTVGSRTVNATVTGTTWTAVVEVAPSANPVTITVKQQSKGALTTQATTQVTATGAQQPQPVTITTPTSGMYQPGQSTTVAGTATPYATVVVKSQWGSTLATRTADVDGKWSFTRTYGPSAMYKLTATQTRVDGTTSTSAEFTLAPENAFKPLTLTSPERTSTYLPATSVLFEGTATPGATIEAKSNWGSTLFTGRADQVTGKWAATRQFGPTATYVITLTQTAPDGTKDSITPVILQPVAHQDITLTSPTQGEGYTPGTPVTFTGTATPKAKIEITSKTSGAVLTSTTANGNGDWSVRRAFGPSSTYNLTIRATDPDGTTSTTELLNFGPNTK